MKNLSLLKTFKKNLLITVIIIFILLLSLFCLYILSLQGTLNNKYLLPLIVFLTFAILFALWFKLYKNIISPINAIMSYMSTNSLYNMPFDYESSKEVAADKSSDPIIHEISGVFDKLNGLIELIQNINNNSSFSDVLKYIYYSFTPFIPFTYIGIAILEDNGDTIKAAYGISDDSLNGPSPASKLLGYKTKLSETSLVTVINTGKPRIINNLEKYTADKPVKPYNKIILDVGIQSSITLPIIYENETIGILFFSSKNKNSYTHEHAQFLETIANSIAISFAKNILIKDLVLSSLIALAKLAESRDEDTGEHLHRMSLYSKTLAELLYKESSYRSMINPDFIEDVEKFSPVHDIGKVGISDSILLKPGKLTAEEFESIKSHTMYGGNVLRAANKNISQNDKTFFKMGIEITENHHEKWDGSGYPNGKKGKEIPLSARIVALADVFDALTSRRPYKEPFPFKKSIEIINEGSGSHFDPEIVRIFNENIAIIYSLYKKLNDNDA